MLNSESKRLIVIFSQNWSFIEKFLISFTIYLSAFVVLIFHMKYNYLGLSFSFVKVCKERVKCQTFNIWNEISEKKNYCTSQEDANFMTAFKFMISDCQILEEKKTIMFSKSPVNSEWTPY